MRNWIFTIGFCLASPLTAHEYWIEPLDFTVPQGEAMQANLKVGQVFKGITYPFAPSRFRTFAIIQNGVQTEYKGIPGDNPALQQSEPATGLNTILYHSMADTLNIRENGFWEKYLLDEGLSDALQKHRADGLSEIGFQEQYTRNAKSLVQIGPYQGEVDQPVGMPLELVVDGSPYAPGTTHVRVKLIWQGVPVPNHPVNVFTKSPDIHKTLIHTDENGMAEVAFPEGSSILLNSVRIMRNDEGQDPLYQSWWASLTFGH